MACLNPQNYQNRLRHSDYQALFGLAGWRIVLARGEADPGCLADLSTLPLSPPYRHYSREDLAILTSEFVLVPAV